MRIICFNMVFVKEISICHYSNALYLKYCTDNEKVIASIKENDSLHIHMLRCDMLNSTVITGNFKSNKFVT